MTSKIELPDGFSADQCRELGQSIVNTMRDFVRAQDSLPGFEVDTASIHFYLGDSAGELVGNWTVTVRRDGLD